MPWAPGAFTSGGGHEQDWGSLGTGSRHPRAPFHQLSPCHHLISSANNTIKELTTRQGCQIETGS